MKVRMNLTLEVDSEAWMEVHELDGQQRVRRSVRETYIPLIRDLVKNDDLVRSIVVRADAT